MSTQEKPSIATEIFTTLRREILSGKFARNEKFPSEQMLVQRFKVAHTTVRLALNRLKEDGILETRNGSGTSPCLIYRPISYSDLGSSSSE